MKKHSAGWAVIDSLNNEEVSVEETRSKAYLSKQMLTGVYGGKFIVKRRDAF